MKWKGPNRRRKRMVIPGPQKQKETFGVRVVGCGTFFWLVGGEASGLCSRNLVLILTLPSSTWVGAPVLQKNSKTALCVVLSVGTRTLSQGCTTIWLFLLCFCIPSRPWLAIVWIRPLELREGQGGWMKPISCRQETENTEQISTPEPRRLVRIFNSGSWATMTVVASCQNGA